MDREIEAFIANIENPGRREDARILLRLIEEESGYKPYISGTMLGFGKYHYKYESGREGDWFVTGFAPRKQNLAVYIMPGFTEYSALLDRLGKYKTGKSCLYINKLADVELETLRMLVKKSVEDMQNKYKCTKA